MPTSGDLIRRWFEEVWNQGREATIDELCSKDAVGKGQTLDGSHIAGPEHFKVFWQDCALPSAIFTSTYIALSNKAIQPWRNGP
jgi:hypothetical protein